MTNLANVLNENVSFTANGMPALGSTTSDVLDFFSTISTMRQKPVHQIETSYQKAINENFAQAIKLAFYTRSIRNLGQGERNVGRILFKYLANNYSDIILNNFDNIPYYGRFDDFYTFVGTKLEKEAFKYLYEQIKEDLNEEYPSLCAKWLISANLKTTKKKYGILTAKYFMYFETNDLKYLNHLNQIELGEVLKKYRQTLSLLRKKINIVEQKLCAKDYGVPQSRERVIIIGIRKDLAITPTFPEPISGEITVDMAISDLPQIQSGEGSETMPYTIDPQNEYQKMMRNGCTILRNHVAMKHTKRLIERFAAIQPGQSLVDVWETHGDHCRLLSPELCAGIVERNGVGHA